MPTYKLCVVANNEAGQWQSWPEKIAAIKAFYASVCQLDITLIPAILTPQFAPYEPSSGNGVVYRADEGWYEVNVILSERYALLVKERVKESAPIPRLQITSIRIK
jgi:hypothetical protein